MNAFTNVENILWMRTNAVGISSCLVNMYGSCKYLELLQSPVRTECCSALTEMYIYSVE
jgi:hypothetical protein